MTNPNFVLFLFRKPCLFFRFRFEGWYVRPRVFHRRWSSPNADSEVTVGRIESDGLDIDRTDEEARRGDRAIEGAVRWKGRVWSRDILAIRSSCHQWNYSEDRLLRVYICEFNRMHCLTVLDVLPSISEFYRLLQTQKLGERLGVKFELPKRDNNIIRRITLNLVRVWRKRNFLK